MTIMFETLEEANTFIFSTLHALRISELSPDQRVGIVEVVLILGRIGLIGTQDETRRIHQYVEAQRWRKTSLELRRLVISLRKQYDPLFAMRRTAAYDEETFRGLLVLLTTLSSHCFSLYRKQCRKNSRQIRARNKRGHS